MVLLRRKNLRLSTSMVGRILSDLKRRGVLDVGDLPPRYRPVAERCPVDHGPDESPVFGPFNSQGIWSTRHQRGTARRAGGAETLLGSQHGLSVGCSGSSRTRHFAGCRSLSGYAGRSHAFPHRRSAGGWRKRITPPNSNGLASNGTLPLFVLPPRSPELNGHVERSHRTHHEEFYQVIPEHWNVAQLNPQLRRWEHIYNTVRPHQALRYLTPLEFLQRCKTHKKKAECH